MSGTPVNIKISSGTKFTSKKFKDDILCKALEDGWTVKKISDKTFEFTKNTETFTRSFERPRKMTSEPVDKIGHSAQIGRRT
jgi:hypothetical protein